MMYISKYIKVYHLNWILPCSQCNLIVLPEVTEWFRSHQPSPKVAVLVHSLLEQSQLCWAYCWDPRHLGHVLSAHDKSMYTYT